MRQPKSLGLSDVRTGCFGVKLVRHEVDKSAQVAGFNPGESSLIIMPRIMCKSEGEISLDGAVLLDLQYVLSVSLAVVVKNASSSPQRRF